MDISTMVTQYFYTHFKEMLHLPSKNAIHITGFVQTEMGYRGTVSIDVNAVRTHTVVPDKVELIGFADFYASSYDIKKEDKNMNSIRLDKLILHLDALHNDPSVQHTGWKNGIGIPVDETEETKRWVTALSNILNYIVQAQANGDLPFHPEMSLPMIGTLQDLLNFLLTMTLPEMALMPEGEIEDDEEPDPT